MTEEDVRVVVAVLDVAIIGPLDQGRGVGLDLLVVVAMVAGGQAWIEIDRGRDGGEPHATEPVDAAIEGGALEVVDQLVGRIQSAVIPGGDHGPVVADAQGREELVVVRPVVVELDFRPPGRPAVQRTPVVDVDCVADAETVRIVAVDDVQDPFAIDRQLRRGQVADVALQRRPAAGCRGGGVAWIDPARQRVGDRCEVVSAIGGTGDLDVDVAVGVGIPPHPADIDVTVGRNGGPGPLNIGSRSAELHRCRPDEAVVGVVGEDGAAGSEIGPAYVQAAVVRAGRIIVDRQNFFVVGAGVGVAEELEGATIVGGTPDAEPNLLQGGKVEIAVFASPHQARIAKAVVAQGAPVGEAGPSVDRARVAG